MSNFTAGPWRIAEKTNVRFDSAQLIRAVNEGTEHGAVACVALGSANAQLICAAPELLASLELAESELERMEAATGKAIDPDVIMVIRAAIRKAKGGEA